ncbi:putative ABC transporter permease subunit [Oceanobacillus halophilus]|uniref:Uncharacterized protein n=1 Tax=Oceanobacillus halophilus TaxID=930130 RepID=A0A494ZWZ9_9BACI|nr:ABC transporter permease [Oceanobacillus halophilus]RKQ31246.1 hypothetical protein D8M06_14320 [Oceanobacillus halophilus]
MMHKTFLLAKTMLKMQYRNPDRKASQTFMYIFSFIILLPILFVYIDIMRGLVQSLYQAFEPIGQESVILGLLFLTLHFLLFFISMLTILTTFYFSEDIESFIPFPFEPYQLLISKAINPFIYLYITASALYLPFYFFYGTISGASILYFIVGIILLLLTPIVPFSLAAILIMFVMRFVNVAKNKDRSKVIAGIATLVFIIGINVLVRINTNDDAFIENMVMFLQEQDGLLQMLTGFYPPAYLSTKVLIGIATGVGVLSLLGVITLCILGFVLFLWLGQLLYLKGVLGVNTGNKKSFSEKKINKSLHNNSVWISYIKKELKTIIRTPTFLMQCIVQSLFGPFFLVIILMLDFGNNSLANFSEAFSEKSMILTLFMVSIFILGANPTSYTSISREGKNWYTNLFLPIKPKQIVLSKIGVASLIDLLTIGLLLTIMLFFLHVPGEILAIWLFLTLLGSIYTSSMGTYLDFLNPKLNWTDEQELFKMRFIGLVALLFTAGIFGIIVLILWNIQYFQGSLQIAGILFLCLTSGITIIQKLLTHKIKKKYHLHY